FLATYATKLGGTAEVRTVLERARTISSLSLAVFAKYAQAYNQLDLAVTAQVPTDVDGVPNWTTLFGSLDFCACKDCRSIYSPAAYLVDSLHFLAQRPAKAAGRFACDVLFDRRGDIANLELSCENTNTPLPYVDL